MKSTTNPLELGECRTLFPGTYVEINESLWFVDNDGYRVVVRGHETVLYRFAVESEVDRRYVAVSLRLSKLARQQEIAAAFGHSEESQRRWEKRFQCEGIVGLKKTRPKGRPRKVGATQETCIRKWFKEGLSNLEMASRLGLGEGTIRLALKRLGLCRARAVDNQDLLPFDDADEGEGANADADVRGGEEEGMDVERILEASESKGDLRPDSEAWVSDPMDRSLERVLAALGRVDDVNPVFADVENLRCVGVFLAIPLLVQTGIIGVFQRTYQSIGPAFYGLRTTVVCLFLLALLRIKRPENIKEHNHLNLGRLLGLDRAPEVKTIRRKLDRLASMGLGLSVMRGLADLRAQSEPEAMGTLYFDGHVKEYHGSFETSKAFISRRRLAAPAATDTWVNDQNGAPLFVVQSEMNEGLTKTLEPILIDAQEIVGSNRSVTVVFDRGGWSPSLFHRLIERGFHIITYRRGHSPKIPRSHFQKRTCEKEGKHFAYELNDAPRVRIGKTGNKKKQGPKYLWMRQVTRLRNERWQTAVITDRSDLAPEEVLYLMFNRWRQENFFKYMRDEFELDALLKYGSEPVSQDLDRPNPEVSQLDKVLRQARAELKEAQRVVGELLKNNKESTRRTTRGFKIANSAAMKRVVEAEEKIERLRERKAKLPKRISAEDVVRLKRERNLIADSIKISAFQVESRLFAMLQDAYPRRVHEGRTLLHAAFQSSGRIEVRERELHITLAPQSSPHRTQAVSNLCDKLNRIGAKFPGTDKRLVLSLEAHKPVKM